MFARIRYRLWQFWQELWARPLSAQAWQHVADRLSPAELALFRRFAPSDQVHSYRVMQTLLAAGHDDPHLLKAALLHDVGKTRVRLYLWDRVLVVLGKAFLPNKMAAWGQGRPSGWRKAFVVKANHAAWGAEMAEQAGSDPAVVALIHYHQDDLAAVPETAVSRHLLRLLQWADDQN